MYSYEERMRAVELYIKLGKRAQATIRELGYPTKNESPRFYRRPVASFYATISSTSCCA